MNEKIIIIAGPTASGKTAMAVELAKKINGEIINADSRSIYKEMDIGTGKPTKEEMSGILHHLFDIANPDERFSVSEFVKLAKEKISDIQSRNHIPIIVGGTGLYIDALVYEYSFNESKEDQKLRRDLEKLTLEELQKKIKQLDIKVKNESEFKNKRRLIRTLEIYLQTGKTKSEAKNPLPKNIYYFAIEVDRKELYEQINQRVDKWMEEGFENEVRKLLKKYKLRDPGMNGIGYKQMGLYLNEKITKEEAIEKFKQGDRNLAKRQLTWFKKNKDIVWINNLSRIENYLGIKKVL